jgi:hypothetical protein
MLSSETSRARPKTLPESVSVVELGTILILLKSLLRLNKLGIKSSLKICQTYNLKLGVAK